MPFFQLVEGLNTTTEVITVIIIGLYAAIAAAGGIGGGTVYNSALISFGVDVHRSTPLTKSVIFAGAFVLFWFNLFERSTVDKKKPAIMWDLVFFIENSVIMGAILGAIINVVLPTWFLLVSEFVFFTYTGISMTIKGIKGIKKDRAKFGGRKDVSFDEIIKAEKVGSDAPDTEHETLLKKEPETAETQEENEPKQTACSHFKYINLVRFLNFFIALAISSTFTLLRAFVPNCSTEYWVFFAMNFVVGFIAVTINIYSMHKSFKLHRGDLLVGSQSDAFDTPKAMAKFTGVGLLAGIVASALGIGGGLIKTPLMLSMGIPPYVTRAASSTMIVFTAFTSMLQYLVMGQVVFSEVWVYMLVAAVMFPLGYFLSAPVIRVVRSTSVIQLAISLGLIISDVFVSIQAVDSIIDMVNTGVVPGFNSICGNE